MAESGFCHKVMKVRAPGLEPRALEAKRPLYHYEHGEYAAFDLYSIIRRLKKEKSWVHGELTSVILFKSPVVKVLLTILHGDSEVVSYQSDDSVTLKVLEGSMLVHFGEDSMLLKEGEALTLNEKIRYSYDTLEETAVLMTLVSEKEER